MSSAIPSDEFQRRLQSFCKESLEWCSKESEKSTTQVTHAIDMLLQNTARVSELSEKSLQAIQALQDTLKVSADQSAPLSLKKVISSLEQLSKEHMEIQEIIQPIIHSLQFQDRFRQNLENVEKMLPHWLALREQFQSKQSLSLEELQDFGRTLLAQTTMKSERDIIRKHIPGLPEEAEVADVNFF